MIVYVASKLYDYEGADILGIYTTYDMAKQACLDEKKKNTDADDFDIEEFELDKERS